MREEVRWFSEAMERKLAENDHKGGWHNADTIYLLKRLEEELQELQEAALLNYENEKVISESVDVANFAMMIADKYREDLK